MTKNTFTPQPERDALLVKYLLGEILPAERQEVEGWMAASAENQHYFDQLKTIWDHSRQHQEYTTPDSEAAWQRFQQRRQPQTAPTPAAATGKLRPKKRRWAAAAAVACLVVGGLLYVWLRPEKRVWEAGNTVTSLTLPDGTAVTLNKQARLTYNRQFGTQTRTVQLQGEGYFDVATVTGRPFIIQAGTVQVRVLGTAFNIRSNPQVTEVIVARGRVSVRHQQQEVQLGAQQKAVVVAGQATIAKQTIRGTLYDYYKTRTFVCQQTPLKELVAALNEAFPEAHIHTDPRVDSLQITATFHQQPLDTILSVLQQTFSQVSIDRQNGQIHLQYKVE